MMARAPGPQQGQSRQAGTGHAAQPPARKIDVSGTYSDPKEVQRVLDEASQHFNLVGALSFGELPEGFTVVISTVQVDVAGETYDVGFGKRGLGSPAVRRIAGAAGVSTANSACKGWAPGYAAWEVTVGRLELDGTVRRETGSRVMDLREGSSQVVAMREAAEGKGKDASTQIREQRLHIGAHAETKAWLRAVRTLLGLRTYTGAELAKPFAVPKLQFTGRTHDPQLKVMFAQGLMTAALGGIANLYGASQAQPYQLGAGAPPPPQLGMGAGAPPMDLEDDEPPSGPRQQQRAEPRAHAAAPAGPPQPATGKTFTIPGGREKGKSLTEAPDECLSWWANTLQTNIASGKSRAPERDEELRAAMMKELDRRQGVDDGAPPVDDGATPDDGYEDRDPNQL